jgi:hypothetical protein
MLDKRSALIYDNHENLMVIVKNRSGSITALEWRIEEVLEMPIAAASTNRFRTVPDGSIRVLIKAAEVIDLLAASDKPVSLTVMAGELDGVTEIRLLTEREPAAANSCSI